MRLNKEDSQGTMTPTGNREERLRKTEDLQCMMTHALASTTLTERSQMSQVFQVTSYFVELFALHIASPIQLLSLYHFIQFLTCTRIPCRYSHCENGLVRCCLHTSRIVSQKVGFKMGPVLLLNGENVRGESARMRNILFNRNIFKLYFYCIFNCI